MSFRQEIVSPEGLRVDGRRAEELRIINSRLGVFGEADGSCFVQQGHTKCLCAVYGPREPLGKVMTLHDKASIKVTFQTAFSTQKRDKKSIDIANTIKQLFENVILTALFPRSEIDIYIQVLQVDGGVLHTAINATSLALIDAGIPMLDFVSACSAGHSITPILDMNYIEESSEVPMITIACLKSTGKICMVEIDGKIGCDVLESVSECAIEGCKRVGQVMEKLVRDITSERASML